MKILFTGASSFSGMWFVKALAEAGHEIITTFSRSLDTYTGIRKQRIEELLDITSPHFQVSFGDGLFLDIIKSTPSLDLLCHHAADVKNYKSPDFNPVSALENNAHNLKDVLLALKKQGCIKVMLTGSVFENDEGKGSDGLPAVSPYGLSKGLTSKVFEYYTSLFHMDLGKFVIPNPFGPYEEGRFTSYLMQQWLSNLTPRVNTPQYVRDNVPISLLALSYVAFINHLQNFNGFCKCHPSYYVESQMSFTQRLSKEMNSRLGMICPYELLEQTDFTEPLIRTNVDLIDADKLGWNESDFWDQFASYYLNQTKLLQSKI